MTDLYAFTPPSGLKTFYMYSLVDIINSDGINYNLSNDAKDIFNGGNILAVKPDTWRL